MNILEVISDQHLTTCMGFAGHAQAITPNMDRLARGGVYFPRAYCQNPICTPSRVSVLSGQYCHNHGYYGLSGPTPGHHGTNALPSFMSHFRSHGYRTAGIGKLHTPNNPHDWMIDHLDCYRECYDYGLSRWTDCPAKDSSPYFSYLDRLGLRDREDSIRLTEFDGWQQHEGRPSNLPYEHSVEGWCVAESIGFIDRCLDEGKPFIMQVSLPRPHQCYTPSTMFWDMYGADLDLPATIRQDPGHRPPHFAATAKRYVGRDGGLIEPKDFEHWARRVWRAYMACITQVDHSLGLLMDHLEKRGIAGRTAVMYHSDHGAYSGTHGIPEKAPGICSDAVCRIPMIWRVPSVTKENHVSAAMVENVDLAPTFCAVAGLPAMETVDGKDITALLRGEDAPVRDVAVTEHPWSRAVYCGDWRFVHYQPGMFPGEDVGELYNIKDDPDETRNLYHSAEHKPVVERMRRLLLEWLIATTRTTTVWPAVNAQCHPYDYKTVGDGKQSNTAGPGLLAKTEQRHYL